MEKMLLNKQYGIIALLITGTGFGFFLANRGNISKTPTKNEIYEPRKSNQENLATNLDKPIDKAPLVSCINAVKTDCDPYLRNWFRSLLKRKAPSNDPELIRFAHAMIDPPSTHPLRKLPWGLRSTPQATFIDNLFKEKVFRKLSESSLIIQYNKTIIDCNILPPSVVLSVMWYDFVCLF